MPNYTLNLGSWENVQDTFALASLEEEGMSCKVCLAKQVAIKAKLGGFLKGLHSYGNVEVLWTKRYTTTEFPEWKIKGKCILSIQKLQERPKAE